MKVVSCKNCGAKYQLDDEDDVRDYECSVCARDLEFLESYPSDSSKKNVSAPKDDSNDLALVYCTSCGLKYRLDHNDNINDFECSSCYGNLRYADEEPSKGIDDLRNQIDEHTVENESATSPKNNKEPTEDEVKVSNISTEISATNIIASETLEESKLRESLKGEFLNNVDKEDVEEKIPVASKSKDDEVEKTSKSKDSNIGSKDLPPKEINKDKKDSFKKTASDNENKEYLKKTTIENRAKEVINKIILKTKKDPKKAFLKNKDNIKDEKSSEMEKTHDKRKSIKKESSQKTKKDKIPTQDKTLIKNKTPAKDKTTKTSEKSSSSDNKSKDDNNREIVSNPKIKGRAYHDLFIEIGLVIALVGVIDIVLTSGRLFSITFVVIGIITFIIGLILNKRHEDSKENEKLIREKLLTLPNDFYVLSYVKLPNVDSKIDHVVVGPTGIFTILTKKYEADRNKKKPSLAIATYSSFKNSDMNANRNTILNFDEQDKSTFEDNSGVKQMSIQLTKNLIEYLGENGLNKFYIEPLICFINKKVSIINIVLTDEDLFLEELLTKISNENVKLDYTTINKCAALLSEYSAESS